MVRKGSRSGNTRQSRAVVTVEIPSCAALLAPADQEDPTTTTLTVSASTPPLAQGAEPDRSDVIEELQGTAVFDATGDRAAMPAWDELVRQHADRVYRLAYRLSGNQHDAEDLTQETFIRVFKSLQNYQPGTFEGWLHRITTNLFLDMVRRRGRIRMDALPEDYDRVPSNGPTPEQIYHDAHLGPDLQAALDSLPAEFRAAVVLRHPGRQAGHRAQPHPPRSPGPARSPGGTLRRPESRRRFGLRIAPLAATPRIDVSRHRR